MLHENRWTDIVPNSGKLLGMRLVAYDTSLKAYLAPTRPVTQGVTIQLYEICSCREKARNQLRKVSLKGNGNTRTNQIFTAAGMQQQNFRSLYGQETYSKPRTKCRARKQLTACENRLKIHADARPCARHAYRRFRAFSCFFGLKTMHGYSLVTPLGYSLGYWTSNHSGNH